MAGTVGHTAKHPFRSRTWLAPGKSFGHEVEVSDAAGPVDRLVAF
jgi:hypothetical protein